MEMGKYFDGLRSRITSYIRWTRLDLGDRGQANKSTNFLAVETAHKIVHFVRLFIAKIMQLHDVSSSIVFNRDPKISSRFWRTFHHAIRTYLNLSMPNHLQTYGQTERTIQTREDMLWACVLDNREKLERSFIHDWICLQYRYHRSIKMTLYKVLNGRRCIT